MGVHLTHRIFHAVMSVITHLLESPPSKGHLRPLDMRRDLGQVADLVELCFADSLDRDGQRYLQQMRSAARNPALLRWVSMGPERASTPRSGYVWEDEGRVVGNLTLIPYYTQGHRRYLIANVSVHPDYRRKGIARSLTAAAVDHARRRGAQSTWLHVREDSPAALNLYQSFGFIEQARRTTWHTSAQTNGFKKVLTDAMRRPISHQPETPPVTIGLSRSVHWSAQRTWLNQLYPPELTWHMTLNKTALRPGLWGTLYRIMTGIHILQWSALREKRLLGVLSWQPGLAYTDNLWLATEPEYEDSVAGSLLFHARQHVSRRRTLSLNYPAGHATQAIQAAGFHPQRTLIWMSLG